MKADHWYRIEPCSAPVDPLPAIGKRRKQKGRGRHKAKPWARGNKKPDARPGF